jgi:UDP-glucose 6-dehydrogenase
MRVSVFGLGHVGCVTAACLADMGHEVIGVDVDPFKLEVLSRGRAPFFEPELDGLVQGHSSYSEPFGGRR